LRALYAPFSRNHEKVIVMDVRSAELTKYAANAMLATRISFMNEMANLADAVGADIEAVRRGIGADSRIGSQFLYAGVGYGGSCFPKDVKALLKTALDVGTTLGVVQAVERANDNQKELLFKKIVTHYGGRKALREKVFAIWGLAFKANTDDMREAPSLVLIRQLVSAGAKVRAYDPIARRQAMQVMAALIETGDVHIVDSADDAVNGADALAVVTEWQEFRSPDFRALSTRLRDRTVFDGRNLYDRDLLAALGLEYHGIGRGVRVQASKPVATAVR
jgi:UDPglucose 6-dehydrogenase